MRLNVIIFLLYFVFGFFNLNAQSYNYTYTDPCTGNQKTIIVPANGVVTIGYYGYVESFTYQQLTDGTFETWTNNVASQFEGSPCSEIVGIANAVSTAQSSVLNTIGILNSLSAISDFSSMSNGGTSITTGAVNSTNGVSNSKSEDNKSKNKENGNNGESSTTSGTNEGSQTSKGNETTNTGSGKTTTTEGGGTENQGSTNGSGNQTTEQPVNSSQSGTSGEGKTTTEAPPTETKPNETEGKTNITIGGTNTIKGSTSSSSNGSSSRNKEGGRPSIVASSDFVGFSFKNSDVKLGAKATGGYTALRWDGARSWGGLVDYTSALKGPNITGFYAWLKNKNVALTSATLTLGFEGRGSIYGTLTGGYMKSFKKVKSLKMVFLGTITYGQVYRTKFLGTAIIAGGTYEFKVGKRLDVRVMDLMIYSPYVSYYNDVVMKSPYVMLPSLGVNIGITKRFKFNINGGGAWSIGVSTLNYTITCGTRLLIGSD